MRRQRRAALGSARLPTLHLDGGRTAARSAHARCRRLPAVSEPGPRRSTCLTRCVCPCCLPLPRTDAACLPRPAVTRLPGPACLPGPPAGLQVDAFQPVMANLNTAQMAVLLASEVVPGLLILLPAATGGIAKLLEMYGDLAGVDLPAFLPHVLALMVVSSIAGVGKVRRPPGPKPAPGAAPQLLSPGRWPGAAWNTHLPAARSCSAPTRGTLGCPCTATLRPPRKPDVTRPYRRPVTGGRDLGLPGGVRGGAGCCGQCRWGPQRPRRHMRGAAVGPPSGLPASSRPAPAPPLMLLPLPAPTPQTPPRQIGTTGSWP